MIHMSIDNDEELEKMCDDCKDKLAEERCTSCGKKANIEINPNFNDDLFNKLKRNSINGGE